MAQPNGSTTTITAVVEAVNDKGLRVNGDWLNVSKFHAVALPMRGALVTLEVQGGRWIQRCDVLDGSQDGHSESVRPARPSNREQTTPGWPASAAPSSSRRASPT